MNLRAILVVVLAALAPASGQPGTTGAVDNDDIRVQYGTRNLGAARAIQKSITLANERKLPEALASLEAAIKLDPSCDFAQYRRGIVLHDLGRVDESMEAYKTAYGLAREQGSLVEPEASYNLGITLAMLERYDEADRWMSRSYLADPSNRFGLQARAMRNLSVVAMKQGHFLCAALRAASARQIDRNAVSEEVLRSFVEKIGTEEAAQLVTFDHDPPTLSPRTLATSLTRVELDGGAIGRPVELLLPGGPGNFILGFTYNKSDYFVLRCDDPMRIERVPTTGTVLAATLLGADLYLSLGGPPRIIQCDPLTGKEGRVLLKDAEIAASIAILPKQSRLYYTAHDRLYELNLASGVRLPLDKSATFVAADPEHNLLFTLFRNRQQAQFVDFIVDGRPLFLHIDDGEERYDPLAQFVVEGSSLLLTGLRTNAGWNTLSLSVSPDGQYVAVVAGGGWRPRGGERGGYGIPLFDPHDLRRVGGYFYTNAYPRGVAVNPVTHQLAAVTQEHALIYHLASTEGSVELKGEYTGPCAWTDDGSKLLLARKDGLEVYTNALTEQEVRLAQSRGRAQAPAVVKATEKQGHPRPILPEDFVPREKISEVRDSFLEALASGSDQKPASWRSPAAGDAAWRDVASIVEALPADSGLRLYRLRQALREHEGSAPLQLELAAALADSDQHEEAESLLLAVLRSDRGRTDLSVGAATKLAGLLRAQHRFVPALDCAVAALRIDRASPSVRELARGLAASLDDADLVRRIDGLPGAVTAAARADGGLLSPTGNEPTLSASKVYAGCADAVVGVEAFGASGTGFFIAKNGRVLTCAHVVPSGRRDAAVIVYGRDPKNDKASRRYPATVEFRDDANDVLVLRVIESIDRIRPLTLADDVTDVGARVFALGDPRLGDRSLERSLTDGIVSANDRVVDGKSYLQHTAAIAPGSSGSPLLDERGLVVGLVSLKAGLAETGFAVPSRRIREILKQLKP